jgi:opacity protein-like surface antigen
MGESTITEGTATSMGESVPATFDMTDGYPFKMGPANFGVGAVVYFVPMFGAEGGYEMHTGYKNKEATIKGTQTSPGETNTFDWLEKEDNVTWKMNNFYAGARFTYPTAPGINPVGCGGLLISMSKLEYAEEFIGDPLTGDLSASGTHLGVYFGGGLNYFVTGNVAITALFKYNMLFEGNYTYDGLDSITQEHVDALEEKWKPTPYLTTAFGVEYYL